MQLLNQESSKLLEVMTLLDSLIIKDLKSEVIDINYLPPIVIIGTASSNRQIKAVESHLKSHFKGNKIIYAYDDDWLLVMVESEFMIHVCTEIKRNELELDKHYITDFPN